MATLRGLFRNGTFTWAAILALALGIGAGTAVFSVVDRILFRSLPYPGAERLVSFGMTAPIAPEEFMLGYDYFDWRAAGGPFQSVGSWAAGVRDCDLNDSRPQRLRCARVDSTLLRTLEIRPVAGRDFTRDEEKPNAPKAAMLSYGLWQSRFGGDPGAIGKTVRIDGRPLTVAGVLPREFELPSLEAVDILVPQALDDPEQRSRRSAILLYCVGRLRPGVAPARAVEELRPLFDKSMEAVPASFRKDVKLRVRPLRDRQIQDARVASWVLLGAVAAVLLIACVNVANLLLARGAAREREFAVRAALGAGRGRLAREALTETALLALAGGACGCGLAFALLRFLTAIAPGGIPRLNQAAIDGRVLLFTLAASLMCGLLFGLAPALQTPKIETLGAGRPGAGGRRRLRQSLVAVQMCFSLVLLAGAGLLLRSLWNLQNQPLGIRAENVIAASVTLGQTAYPQGAQRAAFFERMEDRLRRIPGAIGVAVSDSLPPAGNPAGSMLYAAIDVRGRPRYAAGTGGQVEWRSVTPSYFSVLGIPILQGRGFEEADRDPGRSVAILSDALARRMFPGESPIGQQIRPGRVGEWLTVTGVAANVKNGGLAESGFPEYYVPRKRSAANVRAGAAAIVRTAVPAQGLAGAVRAEIAALDPTLPVSIETMEQRVGRLAERPRFNALVLGIFASLGLLLAAIGLYGVISFLVAQRSQEIGVRMALGATPGSIARMVLRHAGVWTAGGAAAGGIGALFAVRLLGRMLYQVRPDDPWTFAGAAALLFGVALAAAWIPSRRAARVDPMQILRRE